MSNSLWKKSLTSLSKILVSGFSLSLVAGLISPVMAVASPTSNPQVDSAPVNLTVVKSNAYVGDVTAPTIEVKRTALTTFPSIPSGDYYWAHLYNLDTGKYVASDEITSAGSTTLNFPNFIPVGNNTYQVVTPA